MSIDRIATTEKLKTRLQRGNRSLLDVRPIAAYNGWPLQNESRGGHIRGSVAFPAAWTETENWLALMSQKGITPDKNVIAYCRIGERSSHTWFVLTYLLGYPNVRNYDGSWTEWGNSVGVPIEK